METITNFFANQGILGIVILMLIAVVIWQQRRIDSKDTQITELQNKRVSDTNGFTTSYTQTIREITTATRDSVNAQVLLQKSIDSIAQAFNNFLNNK